MSTLDLHAVLDVLLDKIDLTLQYSATTVRLINRETGDLEPVACRNINEREWKATTRRAVRGLTKIVLENKIPMTVLNVQADPRTIAPEFVRTEGLVSYLGVPLVAKNETLRIMAFYTREPHRFTDDEIEFLMTLAGQAVIGIYNARLTTRLQNMSVN
jgi:GAF domain-containing protein